jgi:hypothetical protein
MGNIRRVLPESRRSHAAPRSAKAWVLRTSESVETRRASHTPNVTVRGPPGVTMGGWGIPRETGVGEGARGVLVHSRPSHLPRGLAVHEPAPSSSFFRVAWRASCVVVLLGAHHHAGRDLLDERSARVAVR